MMRAVLWIATLLVALWSGYWFLGRAAMQRWIETTLAEAPAQGIEIRDQGRAIRGYPSRFDLTVTAPEIRDRTGGLSWEGDFLQILSLSYRPWHVIAAFPPASRLGLPGEDIDIAAGKLQASLVVTPGTALALDRSTLVGDGVSLRSSLGWSLAAREVRFATRLDPSRQNAHQIGIEITDLTPDPAFAALLPDLPAVIPQLRLDAVAGFTAPLDRNMGETQPQLSLFHLREGLISWGELSLFTKGEVLLRDGLPEGTIDLRVTGWRHLMPMLIGTGIVAPESAVSVEGMIALLAANSGNPEVLEIPLIFADGIMRLGPLPLGPAPRFD